jgi:hypothetical protein
LIDSETQSRIDELSSELYRSARLDYIGFWFLLASVRRECSDKSQEDQRAIAIETIKELIGLGLLVFNFCKDAEGAWSKHVWTDQDPESIGARIAREWAALPSDPGLGDICWLMLPCTEEGKAGNA